MEFPFSEHREWRECASCRAGDYSRCNGEDRLQPCEGCGQPPRCTWHRRRADRCERAATVYEPSTGHLCGQHARDLNLAWDEEDFEIAVEYLGNFFQIARSTQCYALMQLVEMAQLGAKTRLESIVQERRTMFKD